MNCMEQVARLLGLELNEEFGIKRYDYIYKITTEGFIFKSEGTWYEDTAMFQDILKGEEEIKKIPWKPDNGRSYYYIEKNGDVIETINYKRLEDILSIKIGNCFESRGKITPEIIKKYTDFFNDDERMIDI